MMKPSSPTTLSPTSAKLDSAAIGAVLVQAAPMDIISTTTLTVTNGVAVHLGHQVITPLCSGRGQTLGDRHAVASQTWKNVRQRKLADRAMLLARYPQWHLKHPPSSPPTGDVTPYLTAELSPREKEIVLQDATALVEALRTRQYTAVEVLEAFCHVTVITNDFTNCLTEIMIDEGLARAKELDAHLAKTGEVVGPLHGLPVSIKDHILVKGYDTSSGYNAWAFKTVAKKDAVAVNLLRRAGAVFYVKTANPQTLLSLETNNNVFGRTLNPYNLSLTPGGSSGGESALIAAHGSPLGIGTDIGGSVRAPAAYTGLYGLKGSVARMPHAGLVGSHDGMEAIIGALGPIATSARDLALFCSVMLHYEPWFLEPPLLQIPWKSELVSGIGIPQKLSIAILWDDGVVLPHPPITDALRKTREALIAAGHEVIDWQPLKHKEAWELMTKLYFLDGGEEYRQTLLESGEPAVPQSEWIMSYTHNGGKPFTIAETFKINLERETVRAEIAQHWNNTRSRTTTGRFVDAVLAPVHATLAPPHDTTRWWGYTSYWNLVDYSAATFPFGRHHTTSKYPRDILDCFVDRAAAPRNETEAFISSQWKPETYENAPVSLQLIGRRLNEEWVLGVLNRVEDALREHSKSGNINGSG